MINRIKQWDLKNFNVSDRSIMSFTFIVALMALIIAIPGGTNCASADTCSVSSTAEFTGNVSVKSNTNYSATLQHSLASNVIANFEDPGYTHTGSLILKDSSGDFNLDGGLRLGTSATSTNGVLRWNGSEVQVYNSGWAGVGSADQNVFTSIAGNSGSLTASTTTTSIKIEADSATGLTVVAAGDKLEIQSAGGGGGFTGNIAEFYPGKDTGFNQSGVDPQTNHGMGYDGTSVPDLIERYDVGNCFSANTSGADPYHGGQVVWITYDHATCGAGIYKIEAQIGFEKTTQNTTHGQRQQLYADLIYYESSSSGQLIARGAVNMTNYNQYSQSTADGFHIIPINAVVCMGYETTQDNKIAIYMMSQGYGIVKAVVQVN